MNNITLEVYLMLTCPHCPPVEEYCKKLSCPVRFFDVMDEANKDRVKRLNIRFVPTVVVLNNGEEFARASSVEELERLKIDF